MEEVKGDKKNNEVDEDHRLGCTSTCTSIRNSKVGSELNSFTTPSSAKSELQYKYGTRNILDLKVGKSHTIQLQFHLRASDLEWFNDCNCSAKYLSQLLLIVSQNILTCECKNEIEEGSHTIKKKDERIIKTKKRKLHKGTNKNNNSKKKSAGKGHKTKHKNNNKRGNGCSGDDADDYDNDCYDDENNQESSYLSSSHFKSDNTFLYGEDIQILYRTENADVSHSSMLQYLNLYHEEHEFGENGDDDKRQPKSSKSLTLSKFQYLKPLSKRIIVWCYPFDPNHPNDLNMVTVGHTFPRPELVPISSLFHDKL